MSSAAYVRPVSEDDGKAGAVAAFPYDRAMIERFKAAFPRARWQEDERCWFVPGVRAARRLDRWLMGEAHAGDTHGDARGRDAFSFDPIDSPYLEAADDLRIRTPYSRTVVEQLRQVPWSHWDDDLRLWRVPFRSYEDLRQRWPEIEAAARRNEPEAKERRRQEDKDSDRQRLAARLSAERRRRRYPVAAADPPPLGHPVMTGRYGIVVFVDVPGEVAERTIASEFYSHADRSDVDYVWANWRAPALPDLNETWPARHLPGDWEQARGWWRPSRNDLQDKRRTLRAIERAAHRLQSRTTENPPSDETGLEP